MLIRILVHHEKTAFNHYVIRAVEYGRGAPFSRESQCGMLYRAIDHRLDRLPVLDGHGKMDKKRGVQMERAQKQERFHGTGRIGPFDRCASHSDQPGHDHFF